MFHILGFIFFFVLIILAIGFVILWRIVNTFLGIGKRMTNNSQDSQQNTYQRKEDYSERNQQTTGSSHSPSDKKKIFGEDEGEYVEFEEIKD